MTARVRIFGITLLALALTGVAHAQGPGPCTLSGTLKQKNGTAVNGAQVTCTQGLCTGNRTTQAPNGSFTCPTCQEGTVTVSGTHNDKTYSQSCTCAGVASDCAIEVPCAVGSGSESSVHAAFLAIGFALIRHRRRREPLDRHG